MQFIIINSWTKCYKIIKTIGFSVFLSHFPCDPLFFSFNPQLWLLCALLGLLAFLSVFPPFSYRLVFIQYLQSSIIPVFYLVICSVSQFFLNVFPLLAVLIDASNYFKVFLNSPVVPLDFWSEIINVPLFNLFRRTIYNKI